MADKHPGVGMDHKPSWTDGFPHNFIGWGPKTPDPSEPEIVPGMTMEHELTWRGEVEDHRHFVWRFDGRRRTYHH